MGLTEAGQWTRLPETLGFACGRGSNSPNCAGGRVRARVRVEGWGEEGE